MFREQASLSLWLGHVTCQTVYLPNVRQSRRIVLLTLSERLGMVSTRCLRYMRQAIISSRYYQQGGDL
jgi:hypothetical protein